MRFQTSCFQSRLKVYSEQSTSAPSTPTKSRISTFRYASPTHSQPPSRSPSPLPSPTTTAYPTPQTSPTKYPAKTATETLPVHPLRPSRIPECNTLHDVITYWEEGEKSLGLMVPLKSWPAIWEASEYRREAVKFGNIRQIYDEFAYQCKGDHDIFDSKYPGLKHRFTKLLAAVRAARIERGEARGRRRITRRV